MLRPKSGADMLVQGTCTVLFAFNAGREIDLAEAERFLSTLPGRGFRHKHRAASSVPGLPSLRMLRELPVLEVAGRRTQPEVQIELYRFGVVSVAYALPLDGRLSELVDLAVHLYDHAPLREGAHAGAVDVLRHLGGFEDRPRTLDPFEDYVIYQIRSGDVGAAELLPAHERVVASVLRAEEGDLSRQEIADALARRVSYTSSDVTLVDWLAALVVGEDTEDERYVLELATVELAALRFLERELEGAIDAAIRTQARARGPLRFFSWRSRELERIASLETVHTRLHEGADNPLKMLGDDYLARLYRIASERFHFDEWDAAIERKLETLQSVYAKLSELAGMRRAETLEWIIIALIAGEILLHFAPGGGGS